MLGVDISEHNGIVDFEELLRNGVEFVIIRIGYGDDIENQDDKQFRRNAAEVERLGTPWAAYIYSYAQRADQARSEAAHCARLLEGYKPAAIFFDSEEACDDPMNMFAIFADELESKRNEPIGLYCSESWYYDNDFDSIDCEPLWIANWSSEPRSQCCIWQYTSDLMISGKRFDGNICEGSLFRQGTNIDYPLSENMANFINDVAGNVIKGVYGNGTERVNLLESITENAQNIVNELLKWYDGCSGRIAIANDILDLARLIMNGDADNGFRREDIMLDFPHSVQNEVNKLC